MLVLGRKAGQQIDIYDKSDQTMRITIMVTGFSPGRSENQQARVGVMAPPNFMITRPDAKDGPTPESVQSLTNVVHNTFNATEIEKES